MNAMTYEKSVDYWNEYYSKQHPPLAPSPFAIYVKKYLKKEQSLLELGCGNGRDSIFFANKLGLHVTAVDQSECAIDFLRNNYANSDLKFIVGNFSKLNVMSSFDNIYSRFTLHSINKHAQTKTLKWASENLKKNGFIFIEARSIKDVLFGKGIKVSKNAFVTDHYRRFLSIKELIKELSGLGLKVVEQIQARGLAIHKDEDPIVLRVIAQKT